MAIVLIDGFDHYPTGTDRAGPKLSEVNSYDVTSTAGVDIVPSDRFGNQGKCLAPHSGYFRITNNTWWATTNCAWMSFALKFSANPYTAIDIARFSNSDNEIQLRLQRNDNDGVVTLTTSGGTVLATAGTTMNEDTWYWIEIKCHIDNAGSFELRVDGSTWINYSGDTNYAAADVLLSQILIEGDSGFGLDYTYIDDLVLQNDAHTESAWLGDSRITTLYPRTDNTVQFSTFPNTGDDNARFVGDEGLDGPNDDDYYVYTSTAGHEDIYNYDTIDNADTVHAVSLHYRARKTNTAPRTVRSTVSAGSQTGTTNELSINYQSFHDVFETDGVDAWNQTDVGNSNFGFEVVS